MRDAHVCLARKSAETQSAKWSNQEGWNMSKADIAEATRDFIFNQTMLRIKDPERSVPQLWVNSRVAFWRNTNAARCAGSFGT